MMRDSFQFISLLKSLPSLCCGGRERELVGLIGRVADFCRLDSGCQLRWFDKVCVSCRCVVLVTRLVVQVLQAGLCQLCWSVWPGV